MSNDQPTFIEFKQGAITYAFHIRFKEEENGMYSWYIPAFDIFFSSRSKEEGVKRSQAMTQSFFKVWLNNEGFRSLILQIHKLGFKSPNHQVIIRDLLSKKINTARFKSKDVLIPKEFINSESMAEEGEMAL